jgi:hypothetical protein
MAQTGMTETDSEGRNLLPSLARPGRNGWDRRSTETEANCNGQERAKAVRFEADWFSQPVLRAAEADQAV